VGGLAGILYGEEAIPSYWLEQLIKLEDIEKLCDTLAARTQVF
jgi:ADP-ribosylglycohydrolase